MRKILLVIIAASVAVFIASLALTDHTNAGVIFGRPHLMAQTVDFDISLLADSSAGWNRVLEEMPGNTRKIRINTIGHLGEVFNDSNMVHWAAAESIGIKPLTDTRSHFDPGRDLVKVVSCRDFYVDELTYSSPYLVPEAATLLHEIGRRFNDSLAARGGGAYRIRVTSVLRTPESVSRLRRRNSNAVDSSVHQLGTTFDITYSRFACSDSMQPRRSAEDLKNLLGEVLYGLRKEGWCYIKFERQQPCYHITARKRD
ncbi:MAG TPA: DUF5715 family protein [Candidatus Amulumruptor caecigallinarius]|uniref:DUF5715 family protein n=1 Tax=Candidatus Amulumruptor caecigallinarius TaxID=2109911 RepID=A0A921JI84_9BACT|nr:DUF5715 family protein [Candidatus Amulumruptor caecigallinarius]